MQRAQKKASDEMESIQDFDHIHSGKRMTDYNKQPRVWEQKVKKTTVSTVVRHAVRSTAQHLGRHAVHVESRTISKQYAGAPRNKC